MKRAEPEDEYQWATIEEFMPDLDKALKDGWEFFDGRFRRKIIRSKVGGTPSS